MRTVDVDSFYRGGFGLDPLAALRDGMPGVDAGAGYPPYNIEMLDGHRYGITLAVAGFTRKELDIQVENGVLTVRGNKTAVDERNYLYQGVAERPFVCRFNLADYIEVTGADLADGLLRISLVREIPEAMKPKKIAINQPGGVLTQATDEKSDDRANKAA